MQTFYDILFWLNNVLMGFCTLAFGIQFVYTLLFFLPKRKYKKTDRTHRFAVVIPARNEQSVIVDTIRSIRAAAYPQDKIDIFVFCHNCTDETAARADEAGATAIEIEDRNPAHARKSWCLKHGFDRLLAEYDGCDAFVMLDADTLVHRDYFARMNDAYDAGVKLGRSYQSAKNLDQNVITGVSGLWYIRDCRFACHARERLGIGQMMVGSGMMIDAGILREEGGWTDMGISEDAEFTLNQFYRGRKARYVPDAIIYEDQPTTVKETFKRNVRMGNGLHKLFWTDGVRCLGKFFTTFRFTYLDLFLSLLFMPIAVICCTWMPFFYGFDIIYSAAIGNLAHAADVGIVIGWVLLFAFVVPFILQALLVVLLERKRLPVANKARLVPTILLFPLFMIIYAAGIFFGSITKPKWRAIRRSSVTLADLDAAAGHDKPDAPKSDALGSSDAPSIDPAASGTPEVSEPQTNQTDETPSEADRISAPTTETTAPARVSSPVGLP